MDPKAMSPQQTAFRSRTEREREVNLLERYRDIAIPAVVAASAMRPVKKVAAAVVPSRFAYAD